MNKYESVVIINPKLSKKEIGETIEKYKNVMKEFSNKNVNVENLGEKKLAYEVKGNKTGVYVIFKFYANLRDINDLEVKYRVDDNIMKYINVRQEIYEHNEQTDNEDEEVL